MTEYFCRWNDEMSVGSEELDNQHRRMVDILNEVYQAYIRDEHEEIGKILEVLSEYLIYHFTMEEVYFEMSDFYEQRKSY